VAAKAPVISSFTPSAARIKQGESVTLNWATTDATSTTINGKPVTPPANGSLSVTPTDTTIYNLVANGSGNVAPANSSFTVTVEKAPSLPPQPPSGDPAKEIMAALDRHKQAYATLLVAEVKKEWTGMNKDQEKGLKNSFGSLRAMAIQYDGCSTPQVSASGDTATMACTETMSYTADNKRQSRPSQVTITLRKTSGVWRIENKAGK